MSYVIDTTIHCYDCGTPLPYDLAVIIDLTIEQKQDGIEHVCLLCSDCEMLDMEA